MSNVHYQFFNVSYLKDNELITYCQAQAVGRVWTQSVLNASKQQTQRNYVVTVNRKSINPQGDWPSNAQLSFGSLTAENESENDFLRCFSRHMLWIKRNCVPNGNVKKPEWRSNIFTLNGADALLGKPHGAQTNYATFVTFRGISKTFL